ncbi:hypothetical protein HZB88_02665 [archaeon]|nr:hypothetical protein [archaeon]
MKKSLDCQYIFKKQFLIMAMEVGWSLVDLFAFFFLALSSNVVFFLSAEMDPKKRVTLSVFVLGFGLNLIGLSHLFRIGFEEQIPMFIPSVQLLGTLFMLIGLILSFYHRTFELSALRQRDGEVKDTISTLKRKYYKQEISEEDLRSTYSNLLRELAELEVKLRRTSKKS